jgi:cytochrome c oxidase subunit III
MSADGASLQATLPTEVSGRISPGWWGMVMLILTEATLFATLLASYFYLRAGSGSWPLDGIKPPDLLLPAIMTVILLSSSIPMIWADWSIRRGRQLPMKLGLALTFILGAIFLGLQVYELTHEPFSPDVNSYSSAFYVITCLHGLHVIAGLLLLAFTMLRAVVGHFDEHRNLAVTNTGLYWHFVDGVWIFVFASLYVSPHVL